MEVKAEDPKVTEREKERWRVLREPSHTDGCPLADRSSGKENWRKKVLEEGMADHFCLWHHGRMMVESLQTAKNN